MQLVVIVITFTIQQIFSMDLPQIRAILMVKHAVKYLWFEIHTKCKSFHLKY